VTTSGAGEGGESRYLCRCSERMAPNLPRAWTVYNRRSSVDDHSRESDAARTARFPALSNFYCLPGRARGNSHRIS
jgi:hypothetical protein